MTCLRERGTRSRYPASILSKLRMLILEHRTIVYTILSWEIILTVNVLKSILLILVLHLINLSLQIGNFFVFSVFLSETILIILNIISRLRKSVNISSLFWVFSLRKMFWKIVKKLVIFIIILILYFSSSSSEFFIRRIIAFSKISVIRLKSRKDN